MTYISPATIVKMVKKHVIRKELSMGVRNKKREVLKPYLMLGNPHRYANNSRIIGWKQHRQAYALSHVDG